MKYRIALCVGISRYNESELTLDNPVNDANRINLALQARRFDSTLLVDPTAAALTDALTALREKIEAHANKRPFVVVYYAGHAIEIGGFGVLLPSDIPYPVLPSRVMHFGVPLLEVVASIKASIGPKVVIIDACRSSVERWNGTQTSDFNEWASSEAERLADATETEELTIAYSTSSGQRAYDGLDGNSTYCEKLEEALLRHDMPVIDALTRCGQEVIVKTAAMQRPWVYTNMTVRAAFSDLPTYDLVSSKSLARKVSGGTRLQVRAMDGAVAVNLEGGRLQFLHDGVATEYIDHPDTFTAAAVWEDEVLLAGSGRFLSLKASVTVSGRSLTETANLETRKCSDAFGIIVSPDGTLTIVYGEGGYSVFVRKRNSWKPLHEGKRISQIYGAVFQANNIAYLCGASDRVLRLEFGGGTPRQRVIALGRRLNVYDLAWMKECHTVVATCNDGVVVWIDTESFKSTHQAMFEWPSVNVPGAYGRLRHIDMTPEEANLFLADPHAFNEEFGQTVWKRLLHSSKSPGFDLLCCDVVASGRLLAIGADRGLIFLVDTRSRQHVATLDVGSNIGAPLQWMAGDTRGAIHAIGSDSIVRYFEPISPVF